MQRRFCEPGAFNPHPQGNLRFRDGKPSGPGDDCANAAYSTLVAHEYGHFIQYHMLLLTGSGAWYEGCSDALALLVYDAEFFAQDFRGCGAHLRQPRESGGPSYPMCDVSQCSMSPTITSEHCRGELLAALWLDMQDAFGSTNTRVLFLDWLLVDQVTPGASCPSGTLSQSADEGTLVEVLEVADDADVEAICGIFLNRNIEHPDPTPNPCEESAGWFCYADCDGSGALDVFDFLCFQNGFIARIALADCDGDSEFTLFDFLCFENEFFAGCP
jgi:hypothetical protein